jgi:hypothetical protein
MAVRAVNSSAQVEILENKSPEIGEEGIVFLRQEVERIKQAAIMLEEAVKNRPLTEEDAGDVLQNLRDVMTISLNNKYKVCEIVNGLQKNSIEANNLYSEKINHHKRINAVLDSEKRNHIERINAILTRKEEIENHEPKEVNSQRSCCTLL